MTLILNIIVLVLVFVFGAIIGAFLATIISRLPKKERLLSDSTPRKELLSPRSLLIEALTGMLALVSYLAFMPPTGFLLREGLAYTFLTTAGQAGLMAAWLPFELSGYTGALLALLLVFALLCVLVVVTFIDASTREIPNALCLWIVAFGLVSVVIGPTAALAWYDHLIGALAISVPLILLAYACAGSFGLGDVKLMAAAGLFLGWQLVLVAAVIGIIVGGVYGLYLLVIRKKGRKEHFAFGPALCAGIVLSLFAGQPIISWYLSLF